MEKCKASEIEVILSLTFHQVLARLALSFLTTGKNVKIKNCFG